MGPDGLIKYAGQDQPRFDHRYNSATGEIESLGLLIEETRTNLLLRSEELENNTSWATDNSGLTITANSVISPSGIQNADTLAEAATNTQHNRYQSVGLVSTTTSYTFSVFLKPNTVTRVRLGFGYAGIGGGGWALFNLANGTIISTTASGSDPGTNLSSGITQYPNGWFRCTFTVTPSRNNLTYFAGVSLLNSANNDTYLGSTANNLYAWGAQLEVGASQTSYIPTSGSSVTRNIDKAFIPDCSIYPWYNASEGSVVFEHNGVTPITTSLNFPAWGFAETNTGKSSFCKQIFFVKNDLTHYFLVRDGIANDQVVQQVSSGATSRATHSFGYKENNFAAYYAGNQYAAPDYSGTSPVNSHSLNLAINDWSSGGGDSSTTSSTTRRFLYYPTRISDSHLQQLTKD